MEITRNKALNETLTLISRNQYQAHNVRFKIEAKSRRKRSVDNSFGNDTITTNIAQKNVMLNSSVTVENNNRYYNSSNELTLTEQPILSVANSSLNNHSYLNRRRINSPSMLSLLNEKEELRTKIENLVREIKKKVLPLTNVKIALGDDYSYRIGYVIANIDTLYNQIDKLRTEMNNQDENRLKELFEKMKIADNIISNLLHMLTSYSTFVNI